MKKKLFVYVLIFALAASMAAGCSGGDDTKNTQPAGTTAAQDGQPSTAAPVSAGDGYTFELNGAEIKPGMTQDDLLAAVGETNNVFEAPSCAGQGTDYTYTYGSVEVSTVPDENGVNAVSLIVLKDDLVKTPEGVSLFMTMDDMTAAYGDGYTSSGSTYTYQKGNVKLQFIIENDEITSIQYILAE